VASRSPGTCSKSLWLLPSGPDQIHDRAMRGDPPLIGAPFARSRHYTGRHGVGPAERSKKLPRAAGRAAGRSSGHEARRVIIGRVARMPSHPRPPWSFRSPWQGCANVRRQRSPQTLRARARQRGDGTPCAIERLPVLASSASPVWRPERAGSASGSRPSRSDLPRPSVDAFDHAPLDSQPCSLPARIAAAPVDGRV
jgi:hypothetical protein